MKKPVYHKKDGKDKRAQKDAIARLVEQFLERHQPKAYRLVVNRKAIELQHGYWMVVVDADKPKAPLMDVINRMLRLKWTSRIA